MPSYEYFCEKCNKEFEETHSISTELEECPECKKNGLDPVKPKRLISGGTNFILNGGGWGSTGYS
jgi:putative FmdB family regulatory protein